MVKWNDAHGSKGTIAAHEIDHAPYVYTSVGFLIRTDGIGVTIAAEQGEDGLFRDCTFVPRVLVIEEYSLGELKKPRRKRVKNADKPVI